MITEVLPNVPLEGKTVLVTGGTGSLGKVLARTILSGLYGEVRKLRIMSRDEAKQHHMRVLLSKEQDEHQTGLAYRSITGTTGKLEFQIGDVRDLGSVERAIRGMDVVINAAALKQVPSCEYFPYEAMRTNVEGPQNLVRAIRASSNPPEIVVGVSTDKACKPVNVMGMTKAVQERVFQAANLSTESTTFVCVRYGNVLASRGSVIPLFHHLLARGGPLTVTHPGMTRFFLTLVDAVSVVFAAIMEGNPGETFIPQAPSARISDLARAMAAEHESRTGSTIEVVFTEVRPGEKIHEILISEEEASRTVERGNYYVIKPMLPELNLFSGDEPPAFPVDVAYSSADWIMNRDKLHELLLQNNLFDPSLAPQAETLR